MPETFLSQLSDVSGLSDNQADAEASKHYTILPVLILVLLLLGFKSNKFPLFTTARTSEKNEILKMHTETRQKTSVVFMSSFGLNGFFIGFLRSANYKVSGTLLSDEKRRRVLSRYRAESCLIKQLKYGELPRVRQGVTNAESLRFLIGTQIGFCFE